MLNARAARKRGSIRFLVGLACALAAILCDAATGGQLPDFNDGASRAGLEVVTYSGSAQKPHILESTGNGVLVLDYDGDGDQDLYFVAAYRLPPREDREERSTLYRNEGDGTFLDVTESAGVGARVYGHGGCVGDVDSDGLPDIYLTAFGPNLLYRNDGAGSFTEIGARSGVDDPGWSIGCAFLDADRDGDQDLFVGNYIEATWEEVLSARRTRRWRGKVAVMDGPRGLKEAANRFFVNDGSGTFTDATEPSGLAASGLGYTMGVQSLDYDRDGDQDLYLANDSTPDRLYRNRGDGTFEEVGTETATAYNADGRVQGSMGAAAGDYDGDGFVDLVVTSFAHDYDTLYRNLGGELFVDASFEAGLAVPTYVPLAWGVVFFDADHDADLDLFIANGHIYPQVDEDPSLGESYRQRNLLLVNEAGRFRDVTDAAGAGLAILESSRGAASLDLEDDGDLDLVVSNQDARPSLLVNQTSDRGTAAAHWLRVDLRQRQGPRQLLGARVEIELDSEAHGKRQQREVSSGGSYGSESDARQHFGLGTAAEADRLLVIWPNGSRTILRDLAADRTYVVWRPDAVP